MLPGLPAIARHAADVAFFTTQPAIRESRRHHSLNSTMHLDRPIVMPATIAQCSLRPPASASLNAWGSPAYTRTLTAAPLSAGHPARAAVRTAAKRNAGGARGGQQRRRKSQQE